MLFRQINLRKLIIVAYSFVFITLVIPFFAYSQEDSVGSPTLIVFYSPNCHKCILAKSKLLPNIKQEFKGQINIAYRDISDIKNYKLMLGLQEKYGANLKNILPVFYFEGRFLNGDGLTRNKLKRFIEDALGVPLEEKQILPEVDLIARFKSFRSFAIISAGLVDGINPCAFTVIVFFISFLALQGYRKRELIVIGLSFIFAVFLTYLLLGLGLFGFLYQLKGFWIFVRIFNLSVGIFSVVLGILCLYDFFKFKKTQETERLILQLPKAVKNQIHKIIGLHYRGQSQDRALKKHIFRLFLSALVTGILVSILEAICTGQVYLPTIAFVLKTTHLKLEALGYLLLYNLMFIIPLFIIFLFALWGVASEQFASFLKKHLLTVKVLMAILFFGLGIFLLSTISGCYAQIPNNLKPQISDPYTWDFQEVKEGAVLRHNFILKNASQKTLNIKDVNTSCGCMVSKVAKNTLLPGEETVIEVQFKTKGYSGPTQQFFYVHYDDLDNPVIRYIIKAEVVK